MAGGYLSHEGAWQSHVHSLRSSISNHFSTCSLSFPFFSFHFIEILLDQFLSFFSFFLVKGSISFFF